MVLDVYRDEDDPKFPKENWIKKGSFGVTGPITRVYKKKKGKRK